MAQPRMIRVALGLVLCMASFTVAQPGVPACQPPHDHYPFCDTKLSLDERVADLLNRIPDAVKPNLMTARGHDNHMQALPEIGVPYYYWGHNCIHSSMFFNCTSTGGCSTSFPSGPSWAATFDRDLMRSMAAVIGRETRAGFNLKTWTDNGANGAGLECWGPVINMNRDPRWGRNGEGGAEDPLLMGELAAAWTRGLQEGEDTRYLQVAATLKHFDANSLESSGGFTRHNFDAKISKYLLADYYWPAFRLGIRAGAKGIMCSYNSVNGIPTCLDPLMKAAREAWGFTGYVTSDTDAVADAWDAHHFTKTAGEASCRAITDGGCNINSGDTYYNNLLGGVANGSCTMADVNASLVGSLRIRFELGLFDPIADQPLWKLGEKDIGTAEAKALNLKAASRSLVLLSNPGQVLPLKAGKKVAVIGPHANATFSLIQVDTGTICPTHDFACVQSPLAAITALNDAAGGTTAYSPGCDVVSNDTSQIAAAVAVAKEADVVILGLGISECGGWSRDPHHPSIDCHGPGGEYLEAEAHDRTSIDLPEGQKALLAALLPLGKPTVTFLLNGGQVAVGNFLNTTATIEAFYPGMEGARALADAVFGRTNTWGRLPYTVYHPDWVNSNPMVDHDVTHNRTYRYGADAALPFGHGLSYSRFGLAFSPPPPAQGLRLAADGSTGNVSVSVQVTNHGPLTGDLVLMAFLHPRRISLETHPLKTMFDFARVADVAVGTPATATLTFDRDALLLATAAGDLASVPGDYDVTFEDGSGGVLSTPLTITGDLTVVEPFPTPKPRRAEA